MLTYATVFDYLLSLGKRHFEIANSELTYTGEASASATYPLVLVEGDAPGSEVIGQGSQPTGVETFTIAVQVLDKQDREDSAEWPAMLARANEWADQLTQQLRDEHSGQLMNVNKLALPGQAGSALAIGWRVELGLKLYKQLDRNANAARFAPASNG